MIYKDLPVDSVTAVYKLCNLLRLLYVIGDIKWKITERERKYSMRIVSYDPDKRKQSVLHTERKLTDLFRSKNRGWS